MYNQKKNPGYNFGDNSGNKHYAYREIGSSRISKNGYKEIKVADLLWKREYVIIVEKFLNRQMYQYETIHHIDGNKQNNSLDNLFVFRNRRHHQYIESLISDGVINRYILKSNLETIKLYEKYY